MHLHIMLHRMWYIHYLLVAMSELFGTIMIINLAFSNKQKRKHKFTTHTSKSLETIANYLGATAIWCLGYVKHCPFLLFFQRMVILTLPTKSYSTQKLS